MSELDQKLMETATYNATVQAEKETHEKVCQANLKDVQERQKDGKGGRRSQLPNDSMDVDESAADGPRLRNRKSVSLALVSFALSYCHHRPATDAALKQPQRKRTRA